MTCEEIMARKVEFASENEAVLVAADKMRRANVGFLPVCDRGGRVVGTITDRDIATRLVSEDLPPRTTLVRSIMTPDVISCLPTDDLHHAEDLMVQKRKFRVVCVDPKGRLAGVVSLADIAQWETERVGGILQRVTEREVPLP